MRKQIKAVIFDVGEVILRGLQGTESLLAQELGMEILNRDFQSEAMGQFFRGKLTEEQMWRKLIVSQSWNISVPRLMELVRLNFAEIPGTLDIARELRKQGMLLAILSVHGKEWVEHLESKHRYHSIFHVISYSCDAGVCKPEAEAFVNVTDKLGVSFEECLFTDDYIVNIEAAQKLGIHTHHFTTAESLRKDLHERGLLPIQGHRWKC